MLESAAVVQALISYELLARPMVMASSTEIILMVEHPYYQIDDHPC